MNLYVRVGLGMVAALVLTGLAIRFIAVESIIRKEQRAGAKFIGAAAEAMAVELRDAPDRDAALAHLHDKWGLEVSLSPRADVSSRVRDDRAADVRFDFDDFSAVIPIDDDTALVLRRPAELAHRRHGLYALLLAFPIVIITAALVVVPIARQLRGLERATKRLRDGDLTARADVAGGGAIGSLADNFNHMAADIERLIENQKQLLQAVSHEFRTPASRIRFSLEMLDSADTDEARKKRLADIDDNLTELDALVDELLTYVRLDDNAPELRTETVDAVTEVAAIKDAIVGVRDGVTVDVVAYDKNEPCEVIANKRYFRRVVENLVHNGIRHAKSHVTVEYQTVGAEVILLVHDDGPGVPAHERNRVWEPFARIDTSRSRDSGGFGLGLSIVRRIMDWHGGQARVEDSKLGGAMFVTTWKSARPVDDDDAT